MRWRERRRERETWLFAASFVTFVLSGLTAFAAFDRYVAAPEVNLVLAFAAFALAALAPPPVLRFFWHTFANHVGVDRPQAIHDPRVVDGDTLHDMVTDVRYRLANIDAPETDDGAKCYHERQRGELAREVAVRKVRAAQRVEVRKTFRHDVYGRRVAFVLIDGEDLGEFLMRKGLARPWRGQRRKWCGPHGGLAKIARAGAMRHKCATCRHWSED